MNITKVEAFNSEIGEKNIHICDGQKTISLLIRNKFIELGTWENDTDEVKIQGSMLLDSFVEKLLEMFKGETK